MGGRRGPSAATAAHLRLQVSPMLCCDALLQDYVSLLLSRPSPHTCLVPLLHCSTTILHHALCQRMTPRRQAQGLGSVHPPPTWPQDLGSFRPRWTSRPRSSTNRTKPNTASSLSTRLALAGLWGWSATRPNTLWAHRPQSLPAVLEPRVPWEAWAAPIL